MRPRLFQPENFKSPSYAPDFCTVMTTSQKMLGITLILTYHTFSSHELGGVWVREVHVHSLHNLMSHKL